ncbi:MAG: hypothetical protein ACYTFW_03905 [Planctomycetota bacterium]|jgi:hypothetical protein
MKTSNHGILIKSICILLILLASASLVEAYPPDNAAVLYYRAFMILKEPGEDVKVMFSDMREGKIKPNDQIKEYLERNRRTIELLDTAAEIPNCDWGRDDSKGIDLMLPELSKMRQMAFLLDGKAHALSKDGDHKTALNKCLTIHKMGRHVGDDLLISWLVSVSLNTLANKRIEEILSEMPEDLETLTWLKSQIIGISSNVTSIKTAMNREKEIFMHTIRKEKADTILEVVRDNFLDAGIAADVVEKVRKGNDKFFSDSRDYYANFMTDVIVAFDLPYLQAHRRLDELDDRAQKEAEENPTAILAATLAPAANKVYTVGTKNMTFFNAIKAAVDVYIIKAKTGRLPEKLPAGLPQDLFSGKDFEYERSKTGFVLRCRGKDMDRNETYQYEFKVPK